VFASADVLKRLRLAAVSRPDCIKRRRPVFNFFSTESNELLRRDEESVHKDGIRDKRRVSTQKNIST
jgi:hypothetical protein